MTSAVPRHWQSRSADCPTVSAADDGTVSQEALARSRGLASEESRLGNIDAAIRLYTKTQLGLDIPWMSYIEDVETKDGVCRLYGYSDETLPPDQLARDRHEWFTKDQLRRLLGESDWICRAVQTWKRRDIIRGKGKAVRQSERQFE